MREDFLEKKTIVVVDIRMFMKAVLDYNFILNKELLYIINEN